MASFDTLSARRSLEPRLLRLPPRATTASTGDGRSTSAMPLADMAIRSDAEMLEVLRREGHPAPERALAYVRTRGRVPGAAGRGRDRPHADDAAPGAGRLRAGRARDADRLVLDAYLLGFEPLEPRLRGRDAAGHRGGRSGLPRAARRAPGRPTASRCAPRTGSSTQQPRVLRRHARHRRALRRRVRHLPPRGRRGRAAGRRAAGRPRQARARRRPPLHPRGLAGRAARRRRHLVDRGPRARGHRAPARARWRR